MTKKELKQIYYINREIILWKRELERVKSESEVKGQQLTGMPRGGNISDTTGERASRVIDIELIILGKLAEIQIQRKAIMEYINSIDDSFTRQLIYYRHVLLMDWEEIANTFNGTCSSASLRKAHSRWMRGMENADEQ